MANTVTNELRVEGEPEAFHAALSAGLEDFLEERGVLGIDGFLREGGVHPSETRGQVVEAAAKEASARFPGLSFSGCWASPDDGSGGYFTAEAGEITADPVEAGSDGWPGLLETLGFDDEGYDDGKEYEEDIEFGDDD